MADDKSRKALFIALIGILVAGATIAIVLFARRDSSTQQSPSADKIKIEVRANPTAEIRVDGKKIGKTPISLQYPKSGKEVVIEATLVRHFVRRGGKKDEVFQGIRKLQLDRDHLIDFNFDNTTLIETNEQTD